MTKQVEIGTIDTTAIDISLEGEDIFPNLKIRIASNENEPFAQTLEFWSISKENLLDLSKVFADLAKEAPSEE